jgi:glycosyl transferase, family 25
MSSILIYLLCVLLVLFICLYFIKQSEYGSHELFLSENTSELIDAILYINLKHRTDRKSHIEKELTKLKSLTNNIQKIDAIKHNNGAKGCGYSHIKALNYAKKNNYKNVLIVEDDLIFKDDNKIITNIQNAINQINIFDVLMISGNIQKKEPTDIKNISKAINVQTTSCYLINYHYYDKLIDVFTESCKNLSDIKSYENSQTWAIDRNWFKLQKKDNWYIFDPTLAYQIDDYSDIEKKQVNYKV